ncbi:MAG: TlpA family protein disulfide reductase [Acidobacteria bacterium]|nr:TlpA family protein disulfide reductase [Acidobacteriota bacterium]MCA1641921.1 TlpA family protein disulfide reductase [Acidobacteriota bacterium]
MFKAVEQYPQRRREELRAQGKRIDRETGERIAREQRELAARSAAQLAARTSRAPDDLYYLGLLYNFADRRDDALDALRRFIADKDAPRDGANAQLARTLVAVNAAQRGLFEEAERARADFLAAEPKTPFKVYQIELEFSAAYLKAKQYARAAERAAGAFAAAKSLKPDDLPEGAHLDTLIFKAGDALASAQASAGRAAEARATVVELYSIALALPSANLHELIRRRYADKSGEIDRAVDAAARGGAVAASPPELKVAEWIEQQPVKLSELRGRVVLVDFWYDWCGWCVAAFPVMSGWHEKYKDAGLVIIGVTDLQTTNGGGEGSANKLAFLRKFKREQRLPYGFAVAEGASDNVPAYGVSIFPTSVLIDRRGAVRLISVGGSPPELKRVGEMIDRLVKEPAP